jgi:peptidoglycan hydrolase-like protein with peptidoglycan-binding domain
VGDVQTLGADLAAPQGATQESAQAVLAARDALDAANQELVDARQALAEAKAAAKGKTNTPTANKSTSPPPPLPTSSIDRVKQAEADFQAAGASITPETALTDAAATFNAAALSLEMAWLNLFAEAGCMTDEQSQKAVAAVRDYTTVLQKDLTAAGYDPGGTDGVYGPKTVAAVEELQKDSGLPVTGFVDVATAKALDAILQTKGAEAAALASTQTASVQTVLSLAGYWNGPIDGNWTPELTAALKKFQTDLGVQPTGAVDAATIAAFEDALGALKEQPPPSPPATSAPAATTAAPATTEPSSTAPLTSG